MSRSTTTDALLNTLIPVEATGPASLHQTELGPLPAGWRVVRLGEIAAIRYGKARPKETGRIPVVGSGGIYAWTKRALVDFPTLVIGRKGTAGTVWLQEQACWPSDTTFYLEWKRADLDYRFVYHFIQERPLSGEHAKTTLPSLQKPDLESYPIPLPPLPEQRAIAHVLRTVQKAREATERVIAALRDLKRSLMRHLFTYGAVPVDAAEQVALQDTPIGPIPAHWRVVRLGEVVRQTEQVDLHKTPKQVFKYIDVSSIDKERLSIISYKVLTGADAPSRARKLIQANDIIFATVRPYLKRIAFVPLELNGQICSTAFCVLRANPEKISPEFLFFAVTHDRFVHSVSEHQRGSSYPAVTDKDVLNENLPLPPFDEQHEIARILQTVDRKIEAEEAHKEALDDLFRSLLHHLMTAKIRLPAEFISQFGEF